MPVGWILYYLDIPRTDDATYFNNGIALRLGQHIVHQQWLQMLIALEVDNFTCTFASNICRLISELRCTWIPRCYHAEVEAGPEVYQPEA